MLYDMDSIELLPIGIYHSALKHRYETPRQGVLAPESKGIIDLLPHRNFEQGLRELETFERLWILYVFHRNPNWKPLVQVPRHRTDKVGVFATRAPFRPNPIGLSCVRLVRVEGLRIHVAETDLLDDSPVLDIKPYLPYADAFPLAATGWVADACADLYSIEISREAKVQIEWLLEHAGLNLRGYVDVQLQHDPTNRKRKRITLMPDADRISCPRFSLAYRTWRIVYHVDEERRTVCIDAVGSGYSADDLADPEDRYADKSLHRDFLALFQIVPFERK
jgi:tRNA (adenine37-N6)-methyltransferase